MNSDTDKSAPLISRTAFGCPYCGAYTTQSWYKVFVANYGRDHRTPTIPDADSIQQIQASAEIPKEAKGGLIEWATKMLTGNPFTDQSEEAPYKPPILNNCNVSRCYNCDNIAVWVNDRLVYPSLKFDVQPNEDLPDRVRALFDEARGIVSESPKGAAALLRLCIQYLCIELGNL